MRKTFSLTHEKIKTPRLVDSIKHEVKKYLKRERNKTLPEDADYWDFDCRFGFTEATADVVHVKEINKLIGEAEALEKQSFYLEILAKPETRKAKPVVDIDEELEAE